VALNQTRWRSHNGLGVIHDLNGEYGEARKAYLVAIKINVRSPMLLNNLGYSTYMSGDWDGAVKYYHTALNHNENYERAWMNLGLVLTRQERYADALNALQRVLDEPEALNNMGYISLMDGKYEVAHRLLEAAVETSPSYFVAANENLERLAELQR
jgi:Flp pilus assembly protein TadD